MSEVKVETVEIPLVKLRFLAKIEVGGQHHIPISIQTFYSVGHKHSLFYI